jgi:hypothetical protein
MGKWGSRIEKERQHLTKKKNMAPPEMKSGGSYVHTKRIAAFCILNLLHVYFSRRY